MVTNSEKKSAKKRERKKQKRRKRGDDWKGIGGMRRTGKGQIEREMIKGGRGKSLNLCAWKCLEGKKAWMKGRWVSKNLNKLSSFSNFVGRSAFRAFSRLTAGQEPIVQIVKMKIG